MKKYSANGKGTGKLGGSVYVINHGVQIEREYNGSVTNPSTTAQVAQRSRFKLASQVSAALENVIAIPRKGIQSPRNLFVKRNMPFFYGDSEGAQVTYENLQLTLGSIGLPGIHAERVENDKLIVSMLQTVDKTVSYVAYSIFKKTDEGLLRLVDSAIVVSDADNDGALHEFDDPGGDLVIYAYGYRIKSAKAKAKYDNYRVTSASDMAKLIANRRIELSDVYFSATRGTSIADGASDNVIPGPGEVLIYLSNNSLGTISFYLNGELQSSDAIGPQIVTIGTAVKLVALGEEIGGGRAGFDGWFNNGEHSPFSTDSTLEFTCNGMRDIIARFHPWEGLE